MNSFIAWIGGKKLLRKEIVKRFPEEGFTRYVEVFGGAGWVLFEKEQGKELEVFNDRDSNLVNLYRCIKYHCGELQRELEWLTISREQFFLLIRHSSQKLFLISGNQAKHFFVLLAGVCVVFRRFNVAIPKFFKKSHTASSPKISSWRMISSARFRMLFMAPTHAIWSCAFSCSLIPSFSASRVASRWSLFCA